MAARRHPQWRTDFTGWFRIELPKPWSFSNSLALIWAGETQACVQPNSTSFPVLSPIFCAWTFMRSSIDMNKLFIGVSLSYLM